MHRLLKKRVTQSADRVDRRGRRIFSIFRLKPHNLFERIDRTGRGGWMHIFLSRHSQRLILSLNEHKRIFHASYLFQDTSSCR